MHNHSARKTRIRSKTASKARATTDREATVKLSREPSLTIVRMVTATLLCLLLHCLTALPANANTEETAVAIQPDSEAALIKQGRAKAQGCTRCHGRNGMAQFSKRAKWQASISTFVIKQMLLFRGKRRAHEIMNAVAKPLSDEDIYAIAIWYESVSQ